MGSNSTIALTSIGAKTIQNLRLRILPFVFLLFGIALLDRVNIGFMALTMNQERSITSQQYGLLFGIFFFGYFFFEIPSNLLLHKIGARVWIARILISWGLVAMLTSLVHTIHQLHLARFLPGLAEAGYFPGMTLYLTYWLPQREQARALAFLMAALPVTTILGSPVSGLILDHVHWFGISSWRWLLILEGSPAIVCGALTYFLLPSRPQEARFVTADQKEWIRAELEREEKQKLEQRWYSVFHDRKRERRYHAAIPAIVAASALVFVGATRSPFYSLLLLSVLAAGVYSYLTPFWALPSEFLTGFSAAAGIALINSVGNLGGFAGPYMIGTIATKTGSLYAGLAIAGVLLFMSAALVLLLPRKARILAKARSADD